MMVATKTPRDGRDDENTCAVGHLEEVMFTPATTKHNSLASMMAPILAFNLDPILASIWVSYLVHILTPT